MLDTTVSEGSSTLQKRGLPGEAHRGRSVRLLLGAGHALSSPSETRRGAALWTGLGQASPFLTHQGKRGFPPDPEAEVNYPEETGGRQHNVILLPSVI